MLGSGEILEEGGVDFDRYVTWRWQTTSDQTYSGSPALDAMSSIKFLQQMRRTLMENAQLSTERPMQAPESMRGKVKLVPKGMTY